MNVEMLHTEACPHAAEYLPRLRRIVVAAGVRDPVRVRLIADADEAQRERFLGSPTVRVEGRDVEPDAEQRSDFGLSCRLYVGTDGLHGAPLDEWVLNSLRGLSWVAARSPRPTWRRATGMTQRLGDRRCSLLLAGA
jgi:hypothetical protein